MVGGSSAPAASTKPALAPSKGLASGFPWRSPSETAGIRCANCHDDGPLIRSPYIDGVKDANKLPGSDDFAFNRDQPYAFVGDPFSHWKAYKVEVAGNECISCHRLGVNNLGGGGTARDFAIRATTLQEVAKNPPDPSRPNASPIWMPPTPPQLAVDPHHQASAQAIKDCGETFDPGNLPNADSCRITLFAQAYAPGATPTGPFVSEVSPANGNCLGATDISVHGGNFAGAWKVVASHAYASNLSDVPLQNVNIGADTITATIPAGTTPGIYEIVVSVGHDSSTQPILSNRTDLISIGPNVTGVSPS